MLVPGSMDLEGSISYLAWSVLIWPVIKIECLAASEVHFKSKFIILEFKSRSRELELSDEWCTGRVRQGHLPELSPASGLGCQVLPTHIWENMWETCISLYHYEIRKLSGNITNWRTAGKWLERGRPLEKLGVLANMVCSDKAVHVFSETHKNERIQMS